MLMIEWIHLREEAAMALLTCFRITEITQIQVKASSQNLIKSKMGQQPLWLLLDSSSTASQTGKGTLPYLCLLSTKILELLYALNYNRGLDDKKTMINIKHGVKTNFFTDVSSSCLFLAHITI